VHVFELFSDPNAVADTIVRMLGAGTSAAITEPIDVISSTDRG
jgi:hypothetical protein